MSCPAWTWEQSHTHTHTQILTLRHVPGWQRCQWGPRMRKDCHTLRSSNGQADGSLFCSLCLGWWLYSSGCYTLLQPCIRPQFIEFPLPSHFPASALPFSFLSYLFVPFCTLLLLAPRACWCLSACRHQQLLYSGWTSALLRGRVSYCSGLREKVLPPFTSFLFSSWNFVLPKT